MKRVSTLIVWAIAVACFGLSVTGCSSGKKDQLVGKWQAVEMDGKKMPVVMTMEFTSDGKLKGTISAFGKAETTEGTYTLDGDNITSKMDGKEETLKIESISSTEMTVVGSDGKKLKLVRK